MAENILLFYQNVNLNFINLFLNPNLDVNQLLGF